MNTQAMIIIGTLLLVIVLPNTAQTILYNKLRHRHYRMQDYCREKQRSLYSEIDTLREKLWYKENKNVPNPTLDILKSDNTPASLQALAQKSKEETYPLWQQFEKLRPGEPDPRD